MNKGLCANFLLLPLLAVMMNSCSTETMTDNETYYAPPPYNPAEFESRLPEHIKTGGEKTVLVSPSVHAWGAYDEKGNLVRGGQATAGGDWCSDLGRPCHTQKGVYRINSLGSPDCKSSRFPLPEGGAPMPYCMFFNKNQALHGSPEDEIVDDNVSHGCVRMHVPDAEWLRYNFVNVGTKVIVGSY